MRPHRGWAISDLAVVALEGEAGPVSTYDVQRAISRDLRRQVKLQSVTALMGADRRFCWSGRGVYGLFRHDRIPAVRTLSGVSRVLLAAYEAPILLSDLTFVLKWAGYRFVETSLEAALVRDSSSLGFRLDWTGYPSYERFVRIVATRDVRRSIIRELSIPDPTFGVWPARLLVGRWGERVAAGVAEKARRLSLDERNETAEVNEGAPDVGG